MKVKTAKQIESAIAKEWNAIMFIYEVVDGAEWHFQGTTRQYRAFEALRKTTRQVADQIHTKHVRAEKMLNKLRGSWLKKDQLKITQLVTNCNESAKLCNAAAIILGRSAINK